jgi:hypothetical protein
MEATCFSETSVNFELTTRRYGTLHNHLCEDLKYNRGNLLLHVSPFKRAILSPARSVTSASQDPQDLQVSARSSGDTSL